MGDESVDNVTIIFMHVARLFRDLTCHSIGITKKRMNFTVFIISWKHLRRQNYIHFWK